MRDNRMVDVRHGQSVPQHQGGQCMRCECNNGQFECSRGESDRDDCSRSNPDDNRRPENCMMGGDMIMHNEQREVTSPF